MFAPSCCIFHIYAHTMILCLSVNKETANKVDINSVAVLFVTLKWEERYINKKKKQLRREEHNVSQRHIKKSILRFSLFPCVNKARQERTVQTVKYTGTSNVGNIKHIMPIQSHTTLNTVACTACVSYEMNLNNLLECMRLRFGFHEKLPES